MSKVLDVKRTFEAARKEASEGRNQRREAAHDQ